MEQTSDQTPVVITLSIGALIGSIESQRTTHTAAVGRSTRKQLKASALKCLEIDTSIMSPLPRIPALSGAFIVPKRLIEKGPLTLVDFYDWNAEQNPEHPLFRFHDGSQITTICWKDAVRASHRAARFFSSSVIQQDGTPPVVGILANTGALTDRPPNSVLNAYCRYRHILHLYHGHVPGWNNCLHDFHKKQRRSCSPSAHCH